MSSIDYEKHHKEFAEKYFHNVDVIRDSKRFATELFTPDAIFVIGNFPLVQGHEAIQTSCQQMFDATKAIKHVNGTLYSINKDKFISEFSVIYTVGPDDKVLPPVFGVSVVELDSENPNLIKNYRAYINVDPLFIAIGLDVTAGADGQPTYVPRK
mmetsp:Transcript_17386/g.15673  ORF Transcript_17386/g.15673 Transcript_17386/m.15673 type:complete len:155 (+) Transcript_17386:47-511(+)